MSAVDRGDLPLLAMGALMVVGAVLLVAETVGLAVSGLDLVLAAYVVFVVAFLAGAAYHYRADNPVGAAGHVVAVVGWCAGIAGELDGDVRWAAFSLAALGASGLALLYLGITNETDVDVDLEEPW
jgi:hypothetical protein